MENSDIDMKKKIFTYFEFHKPNSFSYKLPYSFIKGGSPGIVFLHGYKSNLSSTKSSFLQEFCQCHNLSYLTFDYLDENDGGYVSCWKSDALALFDTFTEGNQIIVGSSFGAWLGCLMAKERPQKIKDFLGIASAPDFTEEVIMKKLSKEQIEAAKKNELSLPSNYGEEYKIRWETFEDARKNLVLAEDFEVKIDGDVELIHGLDDEDIPYELSIRLSKKIKANNSKVILVKGGDHRLSSMKDLSLISDSLNKMIKKV